MAMYYYASKISAIACGTRCRHTVLQQSRGQRDRDKYDDSDEAAECVGSVCELAEKAVGGMADYAQNLETSTLASTTRFRRRHSEQCLDAYDIDGLEFQKLQVSSTAATNSTRTTYTSGSFISTNTGCFVSSDAKANTNPYDNDIVQYDVPKNNYKLSPCDVNYQTSVMGAGGIMYINGRIVSGPLDSLLEVLTPKDLLDFDKEFVFSFLLSSRLFLRPHELLGKLLSSVPDSESLESLVALLAEWTNKFPYDYRDERMMSHVKHIVARCSSTRLEAVVSDILSALLNRLTDLDEHEQDLRACQSAIEKQDNEALDGATALQYAQILCRLEKKLAKHIGPEEFLQSSSNVLLDKQKKWDQPSTLSGPPGAQDPKKTCNLETYLDWSARLRLFVCNEILQCSGIHDRSRTVELWSGVAQYCLLVGNYNSATAILETLESPPIARLKITWSKLHVTCQQLDCMQRHAEGHGDLWNKQSIVLNENHNQHYHHHYYQNQQQKETEQQQQQQLNIIEQNQQQKTDIPVMVTLLSTSSSTTTTVTAATTETDTDTETVNPTATINLPIDFVEKIITAETTPTASPLATTQSTTTTGAKTTTTLTGNVTSIQVNNMQQSTCKKLTPTITTTKPNDWVVIPVFADIVKLALAAREHCLQRMPNGHLNIVAFGRMAAIVGAFTKHMQAVKSSTETAAGEYEMFCRHMQRTSKLSESELMMASFDCEEPNKAEKLMYDLN